MFESKACHWPDHVRIEWGDLVVPPISGQYGNPKRIFQNYGSPDDIYPLPSMRALSIWPVCSTIFIPDKSILAKDKHRFRSYPEGYLADRDLLSTVGMSKANPLLAKLVSDNEAKHTRPWGPIGLGQMWKRRFAIPKMTGLLGIGRMEKTLACSGDFSIRIGHQ